MGVLLGLRLVYQLGIFDVFEILNLTFHLPSHSSSLDLQSTLTPNAPPVPSCSFSVFTHLLSHVPP